MIKRIFGWILFAWMLACLYGLFFDDTGPEIAEPSGTGMKIGIAAFLIGVAGIGLMMGLGKRTDTGPVEPPEAGSSS